MSERSDAAPWLSVVVPVLNEAAILVDLHTRLARVLKEAGRPWEVVFVDDGSTDGSFDILRALHALDPTVRVVRLNRNWGQHAAVLAGLGRARGDVVVTLDADLQNPPEEIPRLLERLAEGHDVVGGYRANRRDAWPRRAVSWLLNRLIARMAGVHSRDWGCMLRAYRRPVVDRMVAAPEISRFIPALAGLHAISMVEIPVQHAPRPGGRSRYGLFRLLQLGFDMLTGFSLLPIQMVSLAGIAVAALGLGFAAFLGVRRLVVGPEVGGVFTLFAVLFFFIGLQILALGLIGEYVGRIYQEVRRRPQYVVAEVLD